MARNLKTGWVVLATSGSVVHGLEDGRTIEKQWLLDMAETYNTKIHTARIWPDHQRYWSGGKVLALKAEEAKEPELKGEIQLYGIIAPNDYLISANRNGDYTHPSIEVGEDYRGTGKYFLKGLGVTDEPASAGVSELHFSSNSGKKEKAIVFSGHQFNVAESLEQERGILKRIFSREMHQENNFSNEQESEDMNFSDAQKQELAEIISTALVTGFTKINPNPAHNHTLSLDQIPSHTHGKEEFTAKPTGGQGDVKPEEGAPEGNKGESVPLEEFNKLKNDHEALKNQFSAALNNERPGTQAPEGTGGAESERVL
ncbi:GPO family capsid scaffolding protein [Microbulbifer sp. OS29]|uniref:GPO family capsid scaffolding protein n=1 Tax=Microbulbifer okhotskensis TaxID=2926617 RepID=A0A9X2J702_9GAMM|nr:GPO family capsid scaffolding protein [Microbulbifer okhotskensis]MCO1336014.1 GPO family capsid scaffolding protein [Microbulbifer okhotskensis]